jgi:hypothetical protein
LLIAPLKQEKKIRNPDTWLETGLVTGIDEHDVATFVERIRGRILLIQDLQIFVWQTNFNPACLRGN